MAASGTRALALLHLPRRVRTRATTEAISGLVGVCAPAAHDGANVWARACRATPPAPLAAALAADRVATARSFASSAQPAPDSPCVEASCPDHGYECWKCHSHWSARPLFFCPDCEAILGTSDSNADYFTIFEQCVSAARARGLGGAAARKPRGERLWDGPPKHEIGSVRGEGRG